MFVRRRSGTVTFGVAGAAGVAEGKSRTSFRTTNSRRRDGIGSRVNDGRSLVANGVTAVIARCGRPARSSGPRVHVSVVQGRACRLAGSFGCLARGADRGIGNPHVGSWVTSYAGSPILRRGTREVYPIRTRIARHSGVRPTDGNRDLGRSLHARGTSYVRTAGSRNRRPWETTWLGSS